MAKDIFYTFWFEKNLQGDIVAVYNDSGVKLITYKYDAWGNFTRTINNISGTNRSALYNPFAYRGYYYDSETEFCYVSGRYYDPANRRWINVDNRISDIGGSLGVPVCGVPLAVGGDFNIIPDSAPDTTYFGATTNIGFGTPGGEFHVEWGETATWNITRFNIFDVAKNIYIKIMEW